MTQIHNEDVMRNLKEGVRELYWGKNTIGAAVCIDLAISERKVLCTW